MPPDPAWKGVNLAPALRGQSPAPAPHPVFAQGTSNKAYPHPYRMVMSDGWKLIEKVGADVFELYDLREDPNEQHNLIGSHAERAASLRALLDDWLAGFDHTFDVETPAASEDMAPELLERLRGMGYL